MSFISRLHIIWWSDLWWNKRYLFIYFILCTISFLLYHCSHIIVHSCLRYIRSGLPTVPYASSLLSKGVTLGRMSDLKPDSGTLYFPQFNACLSIVTIFFVSGKPLLYSWLYSLIVIIVNGSYRSHVYFTMHISHRYLFNDYSCTAV